MRGATHGRECRVIGDEIVRRLPIRRWVLSVPFALRFLLARAPHVISAALDIVARAIANHLIHQAGFTGATALIRFVDWNDKRRPYPLSWDEQDLLFQQMPKHLATMALILLVVGDTETPLSIARKPPEILAGRACMVACAVPALN